MPRMPSVRRTVIKTMEENSRRIREKQKSDPNYLLSKEELEALLDAARVGHLLNKVDAGGKGKPGDVKPKGDPEKLLAELEAKGPAKASRGAGGDDETH